MSIKRKHTIKEKLGIMDTVKHSDSKAGLFQELGVPEDTVHDRMKEEDKLQLSVNQIDDIIGSIEKKQDLVM
jgi:hypothetical protein